MLTSINNSSTIKLARLAGAMYLLIFFTAGFAQGFVRESMVVSGDAAMTFENISSSPFLFRLGMVSDLIAFLLDALISVILYWLIRPVSRVGALSMAALRLLAHPAIATVNLINHFAAIQLSDGGAMVSAWSPEQIEGMVLFFMQLHRAGYLIAGVFFGAHLLLFGALILRSVNFPSWLGILLLLAGPAYLAESFGNLLWPGHEAFLSMCVVIAAVTAELALALWLLLRGVRTPEVASGL